MLRTATSQAHTQPSVSRVLIGTTGESSRGIYLADFADGTLKNLVLVAEAERPGFLALAGKQPDLVYAVVQPGGQPSEAAAFRRTSAQDNLAAVAHAASQGTGGCHVSATQDGRCVFVSNYGNGSVASFRAVGRGGLSPASYVAFPPEGHGPDSERQTQSHVHSAVPTPDGAFVLVNDLGLDCIHVFRLDAATAELTPNSPAQWKARPGCGPRHIVWHPNGRWVYSINELDSTIDQLGWNPTHGVLQLKQTVQTLPHGVAASSKRACEMVFSKDMRFLYASNRVHEGFAVFQLDATTGSLSPVQHLPNPGKESRHLAIDPGGSYLLSANQFSDEISVFPIDRATGRLQPRASSAAVGGPSCLVFL